MFKQRPFSVDASQSVSDVEIPSLVRLGGVADLVVGQLARLSREGTGQGSAQVKRRCGEEEDDDDRCGKE
jgi:hypothetical protein